MKKLAFASLWALWLWLPPFRAHGQNRAKTAGDTRGELHVVVLDGSSGRQIPARCYLTDVAGRFWPPAGAITYVKPPEQDFICEGEFQIELAAGNYRLTIERGPEYRSVDRQILLRAGERREERVELERWINMNLLGWYSGDLHNHRDWREMPKLLLAEDLNLAPTLTQWVWENGLNSRAPALGPGEAAVRSVDATHAYSIVDTEIERLRDGPGAVDLVGLKEPVQFDGYLLAPPTEIFTRQTHAQSGYVDGEKIVWRDAAALAALGELDFAGLVNNHFNRQGVETETDSWGMIPKERPEFRTPEGMPLWAMEVYYRFLNCGFRIAVSAGSASGVKPSPLGFDRVYAHLASPFSYDEWFRALKAGKSFATNGPMLFLSVNGREPGDVIDLRESAASRGAGLLKVHAEAQSARALDRLEIVWKGKVVKTVYSKGNAERIVAEVDLAPDRTGWVCARAFEKPDGAVRFAHTSPVYVQVGQGRGLVREDAQFFVDWLNREMRFYSRLGSFRSESDRQAMLSEYAKALAVYASILKEAPPQN